jgi:hypothetical protein
MAMEDQHLHLSNAQIVKVIQNDLKEKHFLQSVVHTALGASLATTADHVDPLEAAATLLHHG